MLSPMSFLDKIKHETCDPMRIVMARLALNLYFKSKDYPFDISELGVLIVDDTVLACMGAITWVLSQKVPKTGPESFKAIQGYFINPSAERWLLFVRDGGEPKNGHSPT